jgi:septal ring factor EnvC (AmiA/AmiB activator)
MNEDGNFAIKGLKNEINKLQNEAGVSLDKNAVLNQDLFQSNKDNTKLKQDLFLSESHGHDLTDSLEYLNRTFDKQTRDTLELRRLNSELFEKLNNVLKEKLEISEKLKESDQLNLNSKQQLEYLEHKLKGGS